MNNGLLRQDSESGEQCIHESTEDALGSPHEKAVGIPDRVAHQGNRSDLLRNVHNSTEELPIGLSFDGEMQEKEAA